MISDYYESILNLWSYTFARNIIINTSIKHSISVIQRIIDSNFKLNYQL